MLSIDAGVYDLKRMQRWVADLNTQHHKAEERAHQRGPPPHGLNGPEVAPFPFG
jgi:hypothetical protein